MASAYQKQTMEAERENIRKIICSKLEGKLPSKARV